MILTSLYCHTFPVWQQSRRRIFRFYRAVNIYYGCFGLLMDIRADSQDIADGHGADIGRGHPVYLEADAAMCTSTVRSRRSNVPHTAPRTSAVKALPAWS